MFPLKVAFNLFLVSTSFLLSSAGPVTPRPTLLATSGGSIVVAQTFTKDAGSNSDHSTPKPASCKPLPSLSHT